MGGEERLDLVDADDRVIGSATISDCLRKGLLHRAVAVLIRRTGGNFLFQRRSRGDEWLPGRLTLSCTGHVRAGESYSSAAHRELREELGIVVRLKQVGKALVPEIKEGSLKEREWVAMYEGTTDAPLDIDEAEVEGIIEVPIEDLPRLARSPRLTPDARLLLKKFALKPSLAP